MDREQVERIPWKRLNISSGYGDLYTAQLIRKIPRTFNEEQWAREVRLSQLHSDNGTGPRVFFSSVEESKQEIVMEKYSSDLLEYILSYTDGIKNYKIKGEKERKKRQQIRRLISTNSKVNRDIISKCSELIEKLSTMYASDPSIPFCFGDFRPENIVVNVVHEDESKLLETDKTFGAGYITDMRQIDFDFCTSVEGLTLTKKQYEVVLKMCLTMSRNSDVFDWWFSPGFMFGEYLRNNIDTLENAFRAIKSDSDTDTFQKVLINLTSQTDLPWDVSLERAFRKMRERLGMPVTPDPNIVLTRTKNGSVSASLRTDNPHAQLKLLF